MLSRTETMVITIASELPSMMLHARAVKTGASHVLTHAKRRPASQRMAAWKPDSDARRSRRGGRWLFRSSEKPLERMFGELVTARRSVPRRAAWLRGVRACALGVGRAASAIAEAQG